MWMLVEGIYLYNIIVVLFFLGKFNYIFYYMLGWGKVSFNFIVNLKIYFGLLMICVFNIFKECVVIVDNCNVYKV